MTTPEIRRDEDGTIDEIVATGVNVHFEMMDDDEACLMIGDSCFAIFVDQDNHALRVTHQWTDKPHRTKG